MIGVQPYISFKGNCQEAIDFYKDALGAELLYAQSYGDSPMAEMGPAHYIMHATIKVGDTHIMMCDDPRSEGTADAANGSNISLAIGLNDTARARTIFDALAEGGSVTMPLDKTFWAEAFGMLTDKFGVNWMVNSDAPKEADHAVTA